MGLSLLAVSGNRYAAARRDRGWAFCINMQDITKPVVRKPFPWKEYAVNILIANIPASVGIALLNEIDVTGFLIPLALIFGGAVIVGWIRKRPATWKTVLLASGANIVFFFGAALIAISL